MINNDINFSPSIITHNSSSSLIDLKTLTYEFYVHRNKTKSLEMFEKIFDNFVANSTKEKKHLNKHKCNRDDNCECIELGKILIDIHMHHHDQSNSQSNVSNKKEDSNDLRKIIDKYYFNYSLYLPFRLFIYLSKNLIKQFKYDETMLMIETYLTYSHIKLSNEQKKSNSIFEIELDKYEELQRILIFDIYLILHGFIKTKARIGQVKIETIQKKYLKILQDKVLDYVKIKGGTFSGELDENFKFEDFCVENENFNRDRKNNSNKATDFSTKLSEILDKSSSKNFNFNGISFTNFEIRNSFLSKLCKIILNKKLLIFVFLVILIKYFLKFANSMGFDKRLISILIVIYEYLKKFRMFIAIESFSKGIFKLLINY